MKDLKRVVIINRKNLNFLINPDYMNKWIMRINNINRSPN